MSVHVATTEQRLIDAIRAAGMRVTLPRRAICRILAESNEGFLSAQTIAERVAASTGGIDSTTVYRTLNELGRLGLVHYLPIGNQTWAWHPTVDSDHHHLICEGCGRSYSVPSAELAPAFDQIHARYRFRPAAHHFAIIGLCDSCETPRRQRNPSSRGRTVN
jgi:Fe2+ or Zn2+ uptake regulation protein